MLPLSECARRDALLWVSLWRDAKARGDAAEARWRRRVALIALRHYREHKERGE